jgi:diguanylate cyclase (GGDEF)-like protein
MLLIGLLAVLLSVFYFDRWLGIYSAALTASAYLAMELVAPPFMGGPRPPSEPVALNALVFALVSTVVILVFGSFRERMNELRLFCKLVEDGELTAKLAATKAPHPDDLTLLARSFEAMRDRFAEQIGTDPLTGCVNRRALENRLRTDWRLAKRRGSHVAVVAIDLDHFKVINDAHGHPVGDLVLQQLAGIMKGTARDTDTVARLGGDEFVIVLPDTGWEGAITFAERVRRRVQDFAFGYDHAAIAATVSVGVALARGTDPISPDVLLHEADRSLYKAKTGGRNRVYSWRPRRRRTRRSYPSTTCAAPRAYWRRWPCARPCFPATRSPTPQAARSGSSPRCSSAAGHSSSAAPTTFWRTWRPRCARAA